MWPCRTIAASSTRPCGPTTWIQQTRPVTVMAKSGSGAAAGDDEADVAEGAVDGPTVGELVAGGVDGAGLATGGVADW